MLDLHNSPEKIEEIWRKEFSKVAQYPVDKEPEREICITSFEGNYGTAGFVIAVNGSPPKGMMFITSYVGGINWMMVKAVGGKMKKVSQYYTHHKLWEATVNLLLSKELLNK